MTNYDKAMEHYLLLQKLSETYYLELSEKRRKPAIYDTKSKERTMDRYHWVKSEMNRVKSQHTLIFGT